MSDLYVQTLDWTTASSRGQRCDTKPRAGNLPCLWQIKQPTQLRRPALLPTSVLGCYVCRLLLFPFGTSLRLLFTQGPNKELPRLGMQIIEIDLS